MASGERVRDNVVQVTGDPQPLVLSAALCLLLAGAFGLFEPLQQNPHVGAAVAQRLGGEHGNGNQRHVGGRLQRGRVGAVAGEDDVGHDDRGGGRDHRGEEVNAAAGERERVERDSRRDHGERAGGAVDRKQAENERPGDGKRQGRCAPAQHQDPGGREPEGQRERARGGVGPHRSAGGDDPGGQGRHGGVDHVPGVVPHEPNLARLRVARILPPVYSSDS